MVNGRTIAEPVIVAAAARREREAILRVFGVGFQNLDDPAAAVPVDRPNRADVVDRGDVRVDPGHAGRSKESNA
jgi:hypothetical protein